ncbi:transposase [Paenibacillus lautus]
MGRSWQLRSWRNLETFSSLRTRSSWCGLCRNGSGGVSEKFTSSSNRITKRGSKRLRRALFLSVQFSLRRSECSKLKLLRQEKERRQPYKAAVIACANKLLHHIYAILKKGEPYHR